MVPAAAGLASQTSGQSRRRSRSRSRRSRRRSRSRRRRSSSGRRSSQAAGLDASVFAESVARAQVAAAQVVKSTSSWPERPSIAVDWAAVVRQPERKCFLDSFLNSHAPRNPAEVDAQRAALGIAILSEPAGQGLTPAPLSKFSDLTGLPEWMSWSLMENKWEAPMPIQAQALPILLSGRNLIGIAQTGSGKTIAFLIPMIIHACAQRRLSRMVPGPIGLCLAPTRELAVQIDDQVNLLCKHAWKSPNFPGGIRSVCFYGGGRKADQLRSFTFDGSHIVIATPGRLLDFCGEQKVSLKRVTFLVLDEADRMLEMGFRGDMDKISSAIRPERQTAFFSATWSNDVQSLAVGFCTETPTLIRVGGDGNTDDAEALTARKGITQEVVVIDFPGDDNPWKKQEAEKNRLLYAHIKKVFEDPNAKMLLFVNEKKFADELCDKLYSDGIYVDTLHGGRRQEDRLAVLDSFRQGKVSLLIATDVMGRGLDVQGVTHVVVYSLSGVDDYIHRIGRTGRGKDVKGHALVFFEYMPKHPHWAKELIAVLEKSEQPVPPELAQIAAEVASGKRETADSGWWQSGWRGGGGGWKSGGGNGSNWSSSDWKSGGWDSNSSATKSTDSGISAASISSADIASAQFVSWGDVSATSVQPEAAAPAAPAAVPPPPPPQFASQPPLPGFMQPGLSGLMQPGAPLMQVGGFLGAPPPPASLVGMFPVGMQ